MNARQFYTASCCWSLDTACRVHGRNTPRLGTHLAQEGSMAVDRIAITQLHEEQIEPVAAMLARAVFDDPISIHAIPDKAERAQSLPALLAAQVRYAQLFGKVEIVPGKPDGAAAWLPPTGAEETPERLAAAGIDRVVETVGPAIADRFATMFQQMEEQLHQAVPEAHWYLFILGVDPPRQRQGLGSALLHAGLERAASEGAPAALLTANPRNIAFYQRKGMQIAHEGIEPSSGITFRVFTKDHEAM
jgi:ribosomal protein S18 acetylase RimI-like enzyme